jgi:DNA helicase HerA-like ATPase
MSLSPIEEVQGRRIGTVEFVSPDEIKVSLDLDAPDSTALNAGSPRSFPRVNSYLLIPGEDGFVVGQVEWLAVEHSPFPKRKGLQDFGLVDLPFPQRKLSLNPVGTLIQAATSSAKREAQFPFSLQRGVYAFPTIGDPVLLPTDEQLRNIVESGKNRHVLIGRAPLAGNAEVKIDPDRLFGRHLAVLGNTGSGKSCTIAGLIQWSLEEAKNAATQQPNARFIILDPNGEYSRAFGNHQSAVKARIFKVTPDSKSGELPLQVPLWFWNSAEWCSFTQASAKTQKPTLIQALQAVKDGRIEPAKSQSHEIRRFLRTMLTILGVEKNYGTPWATFPKNKGFLDKIEKWKTGLEPELPSLADDELAKLKSLVDTIETLCSPRRVKNANLDFTRQEVDRLISATSAANSAFGGTTGEIEPTDVDSPRPFNGDSLLRSVEATAEMLHVLEHAETLLIRIRSLLANARMKPIIGGADSISLDKWLQDYIGTDGATNGCVTVLDLSLVPTEVIHVITSVVARIVFESLQRYRKLNGVSLPTVLVVEEAHTFIKRYKEDAENFDAASVCCQVFERIAREGRKFGLGLVLSSQRPSELSPTVLSQCNSFLLHRISNDLDQETVSKLLPDNLRGVFRELPVLPTGYAFLLGWASELPVLTHIRELPKPQQPQSDDPDFWAVWTGKGASDKAVERRIDWESLVEDWQGKTATPESGPTEVKDNQSASAAEPTELAPESDDVPF